MLLHLPEWIIASQVYSEGSTVQEFALFVLMIIQGDADLLADNCMVDRVRLVIKHQFSLRIPAQPAVDSFLLRFCDIFKVAFQFKLSRLHTGTDVVTSIAVIRRQIADFIVFHVIATSLGVRVIPTILIAGMHTCKAESIHSILSVQEEGRSSQPDAAHRHAS